MPKVQQELDTISITTHSECVCLGEMTGSWTSNFSHVKRSLCQPPQTAATDYVKNPLMALTEVSILVHFLKLYLCILITTTEAKTKGWSLHNTLTEMNVI